MSPTLLAHLRRIECQTRADVSFCRRDGQPRTLITDFYRPFELTRMYAWNRPGSRTRGSR